MSFGPLSDVKILDFTRVLSGPFATLTLADQGAEIIKIESPRGGDDTRHFPPFRGELSHYFTALNRNKKSIVLDLATEEGRGIARDLARHCDVVVENFRPGVMEQMGLGYEALSAQNPSLVYCAISGFGAEGPFRDRPAFDIVVQALSGVISVNAEPGETVTKLGLPMGDMIGGINGAIGILTALHERSRTGKGSFVDISMLDGMTGLLGYLAQIFFVTGKSPPPVGSSHPNIVPYGSFPTADGRMIIACLTSNFWQNLTRAIEREDLLQDERFKEYAGRLAHRDEIDAIVQERTVLRTTAEWEARFAQFDVPHAPVLSVGEALRQPNTLARGMVGTAHHPQLGEIEMVRSPIRFAGVERTPLQVPRALGQDTAEVLASMLGLDEERIQALRDAGIINQETPCSTAS
ncbi:MAG TPA: CaiB/BaiF CoA-transferase family protein [Pinirhizobacter sp.]|uniref:CaiB/BaiF CoA transferase family protein n=1 Tax=Pinirhizobacter sp. TaxID=2950432 RepID=UPI002C3F8719|nr:CaiB/BaiF CoA-transferase family protein [Pinirhizobacter sp.]HMH68993.1 CaiB/BaiF CoA-transferase family protein [Pinirhizobacter sp.]